MKKASKAAQILGKIKTLKKATAARTNGKKPCAPGKKRGWQKGRKRKQSINGNEHIMVGGKIYHV